MAIMMQDDTSRTLENAFEIVVSEPSTTDEKNYAAAVGKAMRLLAVDVSEDAIRDPAASEQSTKDRRGLRLSLVAALASVAKQAISSGDVRDAEHKTWLRLGRYAAARDALGARMFEVDLDTAADGQKRLKIAVAPATNAQMRIVDQTMSALYVAIGETRSVFDTVLASYDKRWVTSMSRAQARLIHSEFTEKLADVAQMGLSDGRPELGILALQDLREQYFRRVAPIVKNRYMKYLGVWCAAAFTASMALFLTFGTNAGRSYVPASFADVNFWAERRSFFLLCAGSCVGAWASFAIRNVDFAFVRLATPESDLVRPALRVAFVMVLACLAGVALWTRFLSFSINGVASDLFRSNGSVALLLGAFFGLAERSLSTGMLDQAEGVAARFVKKQP